MVIVEILKNGVFQGSLIGLLAVAFSLVYATTRVFHIALGVSYLVSAYVAVFVGSGLGYPLPVAVAASVAASVITGLCIDRFVYMPFDKRNSSTSVRLVGSLALLIIASGVAAWAWGNQLRTVPGLVDSSVVVHGVIVTASDVRYPLTALFLIGSLWLVTRYASIGVELRATAGNPVLAQVLGHDVVRLRLTSAVAASVLIGVAAAYQSYRVGVDPPSAWPVTIAAAVSAILGGRSIVLGPALAAACVGILRSATTLLASDIWADTAVYTMLLIAMLAGTRGGAWEATYEARE